MKFSCESVRFKDCEALNELYERLEENLLSWCENELYARLSHNTIHSQRTLIRYRLTATEVGSGEAELCLEVSQREGRGKERVVFRDTKLWSLRHGLMRKINKRKKDGEF